VVRPIDVVRVHEEGAHGTVILPIRTARLRLRDFVQGDFDAVHAYASDADVTRFMFYGPRSEVETRAYLDRVIAAQTTKPRMLWELAIVREADDRLIGACDLTFDHPGEADLGFILGRDAWGFGYATEAARTLVRTAFDQLGASRVFATCDVANHASAHVLEKAGLRREATLEHHTFAKGLWWTSYLYAITLEQWTSDSV
jgi:RimJ/RimL family protein N-acetyltransferase